MPELTASNPKITPFLWFADEAEEAATFYVSIFPNARITGVTRYGDAGQDVTGGAPGSVMTVAWAHRAQNIVAHQGVRSDAKSASARRRAPAASSSTRPARARSESRKAPR